MRAVRSRERQSVDLQILSCEISILSFCVNRCFFTGSRLRVAREEVAWAASLDSTRTVSSTTTHRDDSEFWRDRNAIPVVVSARKQEPERRRQCSYVSSTVAFVCSLLPLRHTRNSVGSTGPVSVRVCKCCKTYPHRPWQITLGSKPGGKKGIEGCAPIDGIGDGGAGGAGIGAGGEESDPATAWLLDLGGSEPRLSPKTPAGAAIAVPSTPLSGPVPVT